MRIGISINGIVRDLLGKIKIVHEKYYETKIENELSIDTLSEDLGFDRIQRRELQLLSLKKFFMKQCQL